MTEGDNIAGCRHIFDKAGSDFQTESDWRFGGSTGFCIIVLFPRDFLEVPTVSLLPGGDSGE